MGTGVEIGGLLLPDALVDAVHDGRWRATFPDDVYRTVFGDEPEQPALYDLDAMRRENASWQRRSVAEVFGEASGAPDVGVDPARSVVIGDLGPDMPIVLDYRDGAEAPRVLYLGFAGRPVWRQVAADVSELLALLGRP